MGVKEKELREKIEREQERRAREKLAKEVTEDFERRKNERRSLEASWLLNMNFLSGNQYCDVTPSGEVEEEERQFFWQSRRVFNHIAPAVDARLAKLEQLKPELRVRAFSDEEGDVKAAQLATGILKYVQQRIGLQEIISRALVWSETCGSCFYKVLWDEQGGRQVGVDEEGAPIYEGEIQVNAVPAFEIFPDRLDAEDFDGVGSVIHAQTVPAEYVFRKFGVRVKGGNVRRVRAYSEPSSGRQGYGVNTAALQEGVVLLERYVRPSEEFPDGRLEIVAEGELLYEGALPYKNGTRGERSFPFVKQDSMRLPGAFFASSVIDRLIPVQRAYNAVRNRKHEFLNRISMGVLTVEDGAVDTDELAEEGLLPGKVLVYRQGGKPPELLDCGNIPSDFKDEEEWLEQEFSLVSGVSDLFKNSMPTGVTSATGLQLLLSQDESRLSATMAGIERAIKEVGRQILRLYRQFAGTARLMTLTGENKKMQTYYFNASKLDVSDIQFETSEASTPEEKRAVLVKLYELGMLSDEEGKISKENKQRILDAFGFGSYENARDISSLHIVKASEENLELKSGEVAIDVYDEDGLHIVEHTRFLLSEDFKKSKNEEVKKRVVAHIAAHEQAKKEKENRI